MLITFCMSDPDYYTTALYFFSTVPQVLGALLALLGVFIVFKMDAQKRQIMGHSQEIIDLNTGGTWLSLLSNDLVDLKKSFQVTFDRLKYGQISNEILSINNCVKEIASLIDSKDDKQPSEKCIQIRGNLKQKCGKVEFYVERRKDFIKKSKFILWSSGAVIMTFLLMFVFLPIISWSLVLHWISIPIGLSLAGFSLYLMIKFLIYSIDDKQ